VTNLAVPDGPLERVNMLRRNRDVCGAIKDEEQKERNV
jgi:hypothetical protein